MKIKLFFVVSVLMCSSMVYGGTSSGTGSEKSAHESPRSSSTNELLQLKIDYEEVQRQLGIKDAEIERLKTEKIALMSAGVQDNKSFSDRIRFLTQQVDDLKKGSEQTPQNWRLIVLSGMCGAMSVAIAWGVHAANSYYS